MRKMLFCKFNLYFKGSDLKTLETLQKNKYLDFFTFDFKETVKCCFVIWVL